MALLLALLAPAYAQGVPDTTSAWRYYPLQVGNLWEYDGTAFASDDYRVSIERDTLIEGQRYFLEVYEFIGGGGYERLVRFDTTTANVMARNEDGSEVIWQWGRCPLDAPFGSMVECLGGDTLVSGGHDTSFLLADGSMLEGITYKEFEASSSSYYSYVAGIGFVLFALAFEPGEERLAYVRINGVEYGTPLPVGSEPIPGSGRSLALLAYPNPFVETTILAFQLSSALFVQLRVYDLLGREVARPASGWYVAGEQRVRFSAGGLSAGAYLVRLEAGAEVHTTRLTVQR